MMAARRLSAAMASWLTCRMRRRGEVELEAGRRKGFAKEGIVGSVWRNNVKNLRDVC